MKTLLQDVRYGLRMLRKKPGFTVVAVLTLALGIGATTAIYSVLYATLLEPMPYPHPEQLVMVWAKVRDYRNVVSTNDYLDWKRHNTVFQYLIANIADGKTFNLATSGRPELVRAQVGTTDQYKMMGLPFLYGRGFLPEEGEPGKEHVVLLTYQLWKRLGADPKIVGQQLRMNGEPYTVVGVFAPGPLDRIQFDLVVPLVFAPDQLNYGYHWLFVMGRLKPGVTLAQAQADLDVIARRIAQDHPDTNKNWGVSVEALQNDFLPRSTRTTLWLLLGAVGFVLLIACVNVANLLLARSTSRQREVAVRASLGAGRRRIFAQFLTESLLLAILGGVAGVALALGLVKLVAAFIPEYTLPSEADIRVSLPVLLCTLLATVAAGVVFGCAPAWQASDVDPNRTLKEGGAGTARRGRLRQALVVVEFGLALTLLAGAGLAIHSFWNLTRVNLGVRTDHILTFLVPVPEGQLTQPDQMNAFYRDLLTRVESLPGVSSAEVSTGLPVQGTNWGTEFEIAGKPVADPTQRPGAAYQAVTPGYFQTFGIQMLRGRALSSEDVASGAAVAVVNENFVHRYFADVDPLTQRILFERSRPGVQAQQQIVSWQIVGVFRNVRSFGLRDDDVPEIDVPFWQAPWPRARMAVRTMGDPGAITKSIAATINSIEPDLPLASVRTMDQLVDERLAGDRFSTALYGSFAIFALLLAATGIYGVMAFTVAQRTHEIGLRMALGAAREQVLLLVLKEGLVLALVGLGTGLIGAYFMGRAMQSLLYGVAVFDVAAFVAVAATLLTAALVACYIPARRAAKVDPMVALRYE